MKLNSQPRSLAIKEIEKKMFLGKTKQVENLAIYPKEKKSSKVENRRIDHHIRRKLGCLRIKTGFKIKRIEKRANPSSAIIE